MNIGPRIIIAVGGFIAILGVYLSSFATTFTTFIFLYCMVSSTGFGICTTTHIICAWEWFPNNRGLLTGIISSSVGFGFLYFVQVSSDLANPEDKNPTNSFPSLYLSKDWNSTTSPLWSFFVHVALFWLLINEEETAVFIAGQVTQSLIASF